MAVEDYNPAHVMAAVNAMQPLGKEGALEQIVSYLESRNQWQAATGLFWVLRVLFEMPAGQRFPPVRIGQPDIPPPTDPEALPRFPIVMVREIPFLAVSGYVLGGLPESLTSHVDTFWIQGIIRKQPLMIPASLEGVEEEFLQVWKAAYGNAYITEALATIKAQIARLAR
jgi:hypothetical protein